MRLCQSIVLLCLVWIAGCGQVNKTVIYNDNTYKELSKRENIRLRHVDGSMVTFYKMEVMKVDEDFIYARCWERKQSEPIDYKFNKQEVIIESSSFSGSKAANYFLYVVFTIGLVILIPIILTRL